MVDAALHTQVPLQNQRVHSTSAGAVGRKPPAVSPLQELPRLMGAASLKVTPLPGAACIRELTDNSSVKAHPRPGQLFNVIPASGPSIGSLRPL